MTLWFVVANIAAACHGISKKVHISWKSHEWTGEMDVKIMKRVHRFVKPFEVSCGNLFTLNAFRALKFLRDVTVITGKTMMTLH